MSTLEQYLDPAFVYSFWQGPQAVRSVEQALNEGINCVALAHLVIDSLFEYRLPADLDCFELFTDTFHLDEVASLSDMQDGDLIWFGVEESLTEVEDFVPVFQDGLLVNWRDFPVKHVGIFTGRSENGEPLILHSTSVEGTNVVWPLSRFNGYARYRKIYGVKRLKTVHRS